MMWQIGWHGKGCFEMSFSLFLVCGCLVGHAFLCFCCVGGGRGGIVLLQSYALLLYFLFMPHMQYSVFLLF